MESSGQRGSTVPTLYIVDRNEPTEWCGWNAGGLGYVVEDL